MSLVLGFLVEVVDLFRPVWSSAGRSTRHVGRNAFAAVILVMVRDLAEEADESGVVCGIVTWSSVLASLLLLLLPLRLLTDVSRVISPVVVVVLLLRVFVAWAAIPIVARVVLMLLRSVGMNAGLHVIVVGALVCVPVVAVVESRCGLLMLGIPVVLGDNTNVHVASRIVAFL